MVEGLQQLDFHAGSDPHPDSGSQASIRSQSVSSSHSHSRAQPPRAGPHSKPSQPRKQPKGGAKDVWSFFTVVKGQRECILCQ